MIGALLYLQGQSFKNRIQRRFARLRQPKYLIAAIFGLGYFYFFFFRYLGGTGRTQPVLASKALSEHQAIFETFGALALLVIFFLAWFVPNRRAALVFTEAEIAFLFPAPVKRSTLIHFKLLKSQTAILFTTIFLTLVTRRFGSGGHAWMHAAGWWLILSTINLHFLGSSFARTLLLERGFSNWQRRLGVAAVAAVLVGVVIFWSRTTMRPPEPEELLRLKDFGGYLDEIFASGPAPFLLYPFRFIVRPFLAANPLEFLQAVWPALLVMTAHYCWVIRSNVAFEEGSVELSRQIAERVTAIRSGNYQPASKKASRPLFNLSPTGSPPIALLWKNLISAGKVFNRRLIILLAMTLFIIGVFLSQAHAAGGAALFGIVTLVLLGWSLLIGPAVVGQDLRQDLRMADLLKMFPMRGWQVVLGELLAPLFILATVQWLLLLLAAIFLSEIPGQGPLPWTLRAGIALGAAVLFPFLDAALLITRNAAVLVFPGWFQIGQEGAHGIEVTGQRLIFFFGQIFVFLLALVPAAAVGGLSLFLSLMLVPLPWAILAGCIAAALILTLEAGLVLWWMGGVFERLDLSAELQTA